MPATEETRAQLSSILQNRPPPPGTGNPPKDAGEYQKQNFARVPAGGAGNPFEQQLAAAAAAKFNEKQDDIKNAVAKVEEAQKEVPVKLDKGFLSQNNYVAPVDPRRAPKNFVPTDPKTGAPAPAPRLVGAPVPAPRLINSKTTTAGSPAPAPAPRLISTPAATMPPPAVGMAAAAPPAVLGGPAPVSQLQPSATACNPATGTATTTTTTVTVTNDGPSKAACCLIL